MQVSLTSAQESIIIDAGAALSPEARKLLRERVLAELQSVPVLGDGIVWRISAAVQKAIWAPPPDTAEKTRRAQPLRKLG
jgi:hypothetical protein